MNTIQLNCFVCVTETLSFTKAGKQLFLSVPTVTHHIKTLEYELNTKLFIRNKHKVELTKEGKAFYDDAKAILKITNNAKEKLNKNNENQSLKIVCTANPELDLIANILKELKTKIENLKPEIYVKNYGEALYMLKQMDVDLMFGSNNMILENKKLKLRSYIESASYLVIRKDDPLYFKNEISFRDLENRTIVHIDEKLIPFYSKNRIKNLINVHTGWQNDIVCDDEQICLALIKAGFGVSILPEYRIPKDLDASLCLKPIIENESFNYGIISGSDNPLIEDFIKEYENIIRNYSFNEKLNIKNRIICKD